MTLELQLKNTDELSLTDQREIEQLIEQTISAHKNNRSEINKLALESVTCLAVSESRANELAGQGFFKRLINNITGKNQQISADIDRNTATSQYAAQQMIQKLAEQNLLTFDLVMAVNNKLNSLVLGIDQEIHDIYNTLAVFFKQTRADMLQVETRLDKLERNVNLLHWKSTIEYHMYEGLEYAELHDIEKMVCVVNDFYSISRGDWNTSDIMLLKKTMANLGLDVRGKISYNAFFLYLIEKPKIIDRLFKDINLEGLKDIEPVQGSIVKGIEKTVKIENEEKYIYETIAEQLEQANVSIDQHQLKLSIIKQYLKNNAYTLTDKEVNVFDFSLELLVNLSILAGKHHAFPTKTLPTKSVQSANYKLGGFIEFGEYKGKKILWRIINISENYLYLFSHYIIDTMKFHGVTGSGDIKWGNSSIRSFLNSKNAFLKEFSSYEMNLIPLMKNQYISAGKHGEQLIYNEEILDCTNNYKSAFKETAEDLVFLISLQELVKYLRDHRLDFRPISNNSMITQAYWTRDLSTKETYLSKFATNKKITAAIRTVFDDGTIGQLQHDVMGGVRPAIYLHKTKPNGGSGTLQDPYFF